MPANDPSVSATSIRVKLNVFSYWSYVRWNASVKANSEMLLSHDGNPQVLATKRLILFRVDWTASIFCNPLPIMDLIAIVVIGRDPFEC